MNASEEALKSPKEKFRRTRSRSTDSKRHSKKFLKPLTGPNYGSKHGGFSYVDPSILRAQLSRQHTETSDSVSVPSNRQLSDNFRPSVTRTRSKISDSSTENLTNSNNTMKKSNRALEQKKVAKFSKTNQIISVLPNGDSPEVNNLPDTPTKLSKPLNQISKSIEQIQPKPDLSSSQDSVSLELPNILKNVQTPRTEDGHESFPLNTLESEPVIRSSTLLLTDSDKLSFPRLFSDNGDIMNQEAINSETGQDSMTTEVLNESHSKTTKSEEDHYETNPRKPKKNLEKSGRYNSEPHIIRLKPAPGRKTSSSNISDKNIATESSEAKSPNKNMSLFKIIKKGDTSIVGGSPPKKVKRISKLPTTQNQQSPKPTETEVKRMSKTPEAKRKK